jgi:hypothetical protein
MAASRPRSPVLDGYSPTSFSSAATLVCEEKTRLTADYEEATAKFAAAVTELQLKTEAAQPGNVVGVSC